MEVSYEVDDVRRIVRWVLRGPVDIRELVSTLADIMTNDDFVPGMATLWDARSADVSGVSRGDLELLGSFNRSTSDTRGVGKQAVVVSSDLQFGIARMADVLGASPNRETMTFRTMEEAEAWLASGDDPTD